LVISCLIDLPLTILIIFLIPSYVLTLSIFFFLMIPPPPRSTLFPYTTLFRSSPAISYVRDLVADGYVGRVLTATMIGCAPNWGEDRKSTRLNSSHRTISYAVFCLKKKKEDGWNCVTSHEDFDQAAIRPRPGTD